MNMDVLKIIGFIFFGLFICAPCLGQCYPCGNLYSCTICATCDNALAPTITNLTKSGNEISAIVFTVNDFAGNFSSECGYSLAKIKIVTLPTNGTLELSNVAVVAGQEIAADDLNNLIFIPTTIGDTSFTWNGSDGFRYGINSANVYMTIVWSCAGPMEPPKRFSNGVALDIFELHCSTKK